MLNKIGTYFDIMGVNKIVRKTFQRNLQTIRTAEASVNGKVYHKAWEITEYGKPRRIIKMTYDNQGNPIKGSKIDYTI